MSLAACTEEEDDSPAQEGGTPTSENPPQAPEGDSERETGNQTEGAADARDESTPDEESKRAEAHPDRVGGYQTHAACSVTWGGRWLDGSGGIVVCISACETGRGIKYRGVPCDLMRQTRRVLDIGPVTIEVPAVTGIRLWGDSQFAAWTAADLITVRLGRYSLSLNDRGFLVIRKYERVER